MTEEKKKRGDFLPRLITALIGVPILLYAAFAGPIPWILDEF